ncbi:MAG: hypothetical protein OEY01_12835 [Desulfobulbaceae bacterium]|nr:hypothetical protein [Desulfobulbaceae bacterium]
MNRFKKEELYKHQVDRKGLSPTEIKTLDKKEAGERELEEKVRLQHIKMFPEEYDEVYDSIAEASDRSNGENPMSREYQDKINERRKSLGVKPLLANGQPPVDSGSWEVARRMIIPKAGQ